MCPSEVSDIENEVWQRYRAQGLVVWGILSDDTRPDATRFKNQMGMTYPVLYDQDGMVIARFGRLAHEFATAYPQDWIIGADGEIKYVNAGYEPEAMRAVIEAELAR